MSILIVVEANGIVYRQYSVARLYLCCCVRVEARVCEAVVDLNCLPGKRWPSRSAGCLMVEGGGFTTYIHTVSLIPRICRIITIPFSGDIEFHDSGNGWGGLEHEGAERSVHLCGWSGCLHLPLCPLSPSRVPCPGALPSE